MQWKLKDSGPFKYITIGYWSEKNEDDVISNFQNICLNYESSKKDWRGRNGTESIYLENLNIPNAQRIKSEICELAMREFEKYKAKKIAELEEKRKFFAPPMT